MGFLGIRFAVVVVLGKGVILAILKLVKIMLETWKLVRMYKHICSFRKYTFWHLDHLNFANISIFFFKKSAFFDKNSNFTQSNSMETE